MRVSHQDKIHHLVLYLAYDLNLLLHGSISLGVPVSHHGQGNSGAEEMRLKDVQMVWKGPGGGCARQHGPHLKFEPCMVGCRSTFSITPSVLTKHTNMVPASMPSALTFELLGKCSVSFSLDHIDSSNLHHRSRKPAPQPSTFLMDLYPSPSSCP